MAPTVSQKKIDKFYQENKHILFDCEDDDVWMTNLQYDCKKKVISFQVDFYFLEEFEDASLKLPKKFASGSHAVLTMPKSGQQDISYDGTLESLMENLFTWLKRRREEEMDKLAMATPTPIMDASGQQEDPFDRRSTGDVMNDETASGMSGESDLSRPSQDYSSTCDSTPFLEVDVEFDVGSLENQEKQKEKESIRAMIDEVNLTKGWHASFGPCGSQQSRIVLALEPSLRLGVSSFVAQAWGIDFSRYICLNLNLGEHFFHCHTPMEIDSFQCGRVSDGIRSVTLSHKKHSYGIQWVVCDRTSKWIQHYWPFITNSAYPKEQSGAAKHNPFIGLLHHVEHIIKNCSKFCCVCGKKMEFEGVKPTVCSNELCIFSSENFSLGVDVETFILKEPELSDLHITLAAAACNFHGSYNPFTPFPDGVVWRGIDRKDGKTIEMSFRHENNSGKSSKNMSLLKEIIGKIPSISSLTEFIHEGKLKERCDAISPLVYPLLRWIFSSNRTFMKCLQGAKKEKLEVMKTDYQYVMLNSTPEKELKFQALKKKHGSRYVWHGCPSSAVFSIFREGLKVMSGTAGQRNGSAYGKGVYFAQTSQVSTGYMHFGTGWISSERFKGNLACLILCEIIDLYQATPYYVVPEVDHIQTRFFFIYSGRVSVNIDGSTFPRDLPKIEGYNQ